VKNVQWEILESVLISENAGPASVSLPSRAKRTGKPGAFRTFLTPYGGKKATETVVWSYEHRSLHLADNSRWKPQAPSALIESPLQTFRCCVRSFAHVWISCFSNQ